MSETTYTNDISGLADINELYESSLIKRWIHFTHKFTDYRKYIHFLLL